MTIRPTEVRPDPVLDVQVLALALDADARRDVQSRLRTIAEAGDTSTKVGLAAMLGQAADALLAHDASFTHAWCDQALSVLPATAKAHFGDAVSRARHRFPVEVIRNADGRITRQPAPDLAASTEPGAVIVTLVVATRSRFSSIPAAPDRAALRAALQQAARVSAADLVAMEVVWSPAEENDRVSVAMLEARHPELQRLSR